MSQTLLAVAAIIVFSLFALNQHRAQASAERGAMGSEIEFAATDLARTRLVAATSLAFDEGVIGITDLRVDPTLLTLPGSFGVGGDPGETASTLPDDVDDLHATVDTVTVQRDGQADQTTRFAVSHAVRYVLADAPGTSAGQNQRTLAKEISVAVEELVATPTDRPPVRCTLRQVVTPAWLAMLDRTTVAP